MIHYPLEIYTKSKAGPGIGANWKSEIQKDALVCAIPPEFEGPGGGFSPEDLFVMAVTNCYIATFKVIAEKSNVTFESISAAGSLVVNRNAEGQPWMESCHVTVTVMPGQTDRERLLRVLNKSSESCMVANSIKTRTTFEFIII